MPEGLAFVTTLKGEEFVNKHQDGPQRDLLDLLRRCRMPLSVSDIMQGRQEFSYENYAKSLVSAIENRLVAATQSDFSDWMEETPEYPDIHEFTKQAISDTGSQEGLFEYE